MNKKSIIISFFLMLILLSTQVYASIDASIIARLSTANSKVEQGDEVQVDLYLNKYEYEGRGVDEFVIRLDINEDVIEDLTVDNIITENGSITLGNNTLAVEDVKSATEDQVIFSDLTTDCDYKIFIDLKNAYTMENFKDNTKIISIKYKVKEDATIGDVEDAVKYSVDLSQQVTAADMQNGFSNYKVTALTDTVALTIGEKVDNTPTDDDDTPKDDDNDTPTDNNNDTPTDNDKDTPTDNNNDTPTDNDNDTPTDNDNDTPTDNNNDTPKDDDNDTPKDDDNNTPKDDNNTPTDNNDTPKDNDATSGATGNSQNSGNSNSLNNGTVSGIKPNSTTATSALPAAGLKTLIVPIVALVGIIFFFYKKCEEYKDIK